MDIKYKQEGKWHTCERQEEHFSYTYLVSTTRVLSLSGKRLLHLTVKNQKNGKWRVMAYFNNDKCFIDERVQLNSLDEAKKYIVDRTKEYLLHYIKGLDLC